MSSASVARAARAREASVETPVEEDWLEDELDAGLITVEEARAQIFNHLSAGFGVPRAPEGLVSADGADFARLDVAEHGGVVAVARSILSGVDRGDWANPLFTPWPFSSVPQREAIVEFLSERHVYAEGLWESALATVTAKPGTVFTVDLSDPANRRLVDSGSSEVIGNLFCG